jgi:hypothetical protein
VDQTLTIPGPDGAVGIHIVRPDGEGPFPAIVFFHHGARPRRGVEGGVLIGTTEEMVDTDVGAVLEHLGQDAAASDGPMGCISSAALK